MNFDSPIEIGGRLEAKKLLVLNDTCFFAILVSDENQ